MTSDGKPYRKEGYIRPQELLPTGYQSHQPFQQVQVEPTHNMASQEAWDQPVNDHKITLNLQELREDELALIKSQTGIQDMDELQRHVESIAEKAFKIYPYGYLTQPAFLKFKSSYIPIFKHVLELGKTRQNAIFLDIGCGFGHDTRKTIADGYPIENVIASDIHPEFWTLGHELFKSTPESFPVPFILGDALDDAFIPDCLPFDTETHKPLTEKPSQTTLASAKSLAPLQGHVSAVHASALFHLFVEEQQRVLAKKLASLLSPEPGSVIFGFQLGASEAKEITNIREEKIFLHSEDSWTRLWVGKEGEGELEGVFPKGMVQVDVRLYNLKPTTGGTTSSDLDLLVWSVERI
ncbi:hypothetical protein D9758_013377 [Tetrapyrgos nigripes]|uniref:Methyltransferase domain-containing protein n=1 Tax=Tetrapyrgos nigripes TaxID=182062 RepID=A0A8H5FNB5_9AGAR|nr:hypothetical protein D9758_013377 [Tetrapyrgos nigripes]